MLRLEIYQRRRNSDDADQLLGHIDYDNGQITYSNDTAARFAERTVFNFIDRERRRLTLENDGELWMRNILRAPTSAYYYQRLLEL